MGNVCSLYLINYFGADSAAALARGVDFHAVTPTRAQWDGGATRSYCVAFPAQGRAITGSIKGKGTGTTTTSTAVPS